MAKFLCRNCNYDFELETDKVPRLCPNCGSENSVEKERSAEELLKDLE